MADPILLIHLGDVHIRSSKDPILTRVDHIVSAIRAERLATSDCIVVVCGDIAYSGKGEEYALATTFFMGLLQRLRQELPRADPRVLFIPGNHDCDFTLQSDIRRSGLSPNQIPNLDLDGGFVREFLAVQHPFWEFAKAFHQPPVTLKDRLHTRRVFSLSEDRTLGVTCLNSAWISFNPEAAGKLLYPNQLHTAMAELTADVELAMVHHPSNWMEPDNSRAFRDALEKRADLILTGHEHRPESFSKMGEHFNVDYIAGMALYDPRATDNGFNLIILDLERREWSVKAAIWDGNEYCIGADSTPKQFIRNKAIVEQGFKNNQSFLAELTDVGTGFTHERKHLRLADLFVCPNLLHRPYQRNLDGHKISPRRIRHKEVIAFLVAEPRVVILGAPRSGKSGLARTLYRAIQAETMMVPLFIKGPELANDLPLKEIVERLYKTQYHSTSLESFKRIEKDRMCLIVDDLHKAELSNKARAALLARLELMFGKLVLFADERFDIDLALAGQQYPLLYNYRQYLIEELNRVQRGMMIEKWVRHGRSDWEDDSTIYKEIEAKEKVINTLLGKQLVPAQPIVVLAFLQAMDSMRNLNTANGSYGELYESLITDRLFRVSKRAIDLGIKNALISRLAYSMYEKDSRSITKDELAEVCDTYFAEYQIRQLPNILGSELLEAGIFQESDGNYHFVYPYYFHFFVARYFRDNIADATIGPDLRSRLEYMTDRVYFEDYVNIVVFFLYLTKDSAIIDHILSNAVKIFSEHAPCSLEDEAVEALNKMGITSPRPAVLLSEDVERNRLELRQKLDELEEDRPAANVDGERVVYSDAMPDIAKLNIAFKTIHILGQVLRSFPGSIKRDLKVRIADECYMLGLRILGFALGSISANSEYLRSYFMLLISERRLDGSSTVLIGSASKAVLDLAILWAFAVVRTVSHAIGMEDLAETYKEVLKAHDAMLSVQIIDASIKLDHFGTFPNTQLEHLHKRTKRSNFIGFNTVRNMVVTHFQLYPSHHTTRARFASLYGIDLKSTKLVEGGLSKV